MNFAPAPTLLSTVLSLFGKRTPQPTFTPAAPPIATQVLVTRDTTTHVDPPVFTNPFADSARTPASEKKHALRSESIHPLQCTPTPTSAEKQHFAYPETPRAPQAHRTTFVLPVHDWNTAEFCGASPRYSEIDIDVPPGHTLVCHPTEPGVYAVAEPKTLARGLFFFGFLFPPFWIAGIAILLMPLRTTKDWEQGKSSKEIEWGCTVIRNTEIRWAKRCLVALMSEVTVILLILVIVKYGVMARI